MTKLNDVPSAWNKNNVQFPRLIAEIDAMGLLDWQEKDLCEAMDINPDELAELFDRAQREFDNIKAAL